MLALVAAACGGDADPGTTTTTSPDTGPGDTTTTTEAPPPPPGGYAAECPDDPYAGVDPEPGWTVVARDSAEGEGPEFTELPGNTFETYRAGIFQPNTTNNFWAYMDTLGTVWNQYVLGGTKPSVYGSLAPGWELSNDLAVSPELVEMGADGVVTVPLRDDALWSDGSPITAHDIVFTAETVRDFELGGNWLGSFPWEGEFALTDVTAVDDYTIQYTFANPPGLAVWPFQVGTAPIMSEAAWGDIVADAAATADPRAELYANDGNADNSGGMTMFGQREEGAFTLMPANPNYHDAGRVYESAGGTYTGGPFFSEILFTNYGDQSAAVLALRAGEVDFLFNPLGMQRGLLDQVIDDPELSSIVNAPNGFRYLGFNMRRQPFCWGGARDAAAFIIDKEFMAENVLQGIAIPLYATLPSGNSAWYNPEVAGEFEAAIRDLELDTRHDGEPFMTAGTDDEDPEPRTATGSEARLHAAVSALKADGFEWEVEPDFAAGAIVPGSGISHGGLPVAPIRLISPGPGYDPLRSTYAVWISGWMSDLGFDASAFNTDFDTLVDAVFVPVDGELDFDYFLLGWSLGSVAYPTYHESFFAGKNDTLVNDGNNNTGFNHPGYNYLVEAYNGATNIDEAYAIMWEMEKILDEYKPYVVLFDTGIVEFYRSGSVAFPFTDTLSGLQFIGGGAGVVQGR